MKLYDHQKHGLELTRDLKRVAYYYDMGLGKTFVGSEKMVQLGASINLVICQKSKVDDWYEHFKKYYDLNPCDLTKVKASKLDDFIQASKFVPVPTVYIINYELAWRRPELLKLHDFTLMLDESSLIQNEQAKRSKFIMKLDYKNLILLSGTPTSGKYERLWSQLHMLGWKISKDLYWRQYVDVETIDNQGFPIKVVRGYKNVERLKKKMRDYGCQFLKTDEVFDLPLQTFNIVKVKSTKEYRKFKKDRIASIHKHIEVKGSDRFFDENIQLVGDTTLTKMLYERQLCGQYNANKLKAFIDLVESTNDRLIVFYNFTDELNLLMTEAMMQGRPVSVVNGFRKTLDEYEKYDDSITFIQYQAGAMGLNLQKANKIIYFTPPLSSELFEQSKKRIHRIGQDRPCFYYQLVVKNSIEEKIYKTLEMRRDYTDALFEEGG